MVTRFCVFFLELSKGVKSAPDHGVISYWEICSGADLLLGNNCLFNGGKRLNVPRKGEF